MYVIQNENLFNWNKREFCECGRDKKRHNDFIDVQVDICYFQSEHFMEKL